MDMRLLAVFDEIYKTRSVSRAGENLGIPQTSVSLALRRMRAQFKDPLFVRTRDGMLPTPRAEALIPQLRQALHLLQRVTQQEATFDPATSSRHFRISMTDISHLEFLPAMMNKIAAKGPHIQIEVLRITGDTPHALAAGDSDLAIGYMPELEAGFYQQKLFADQFACVVRKNHPRIRTQLTAQGFKNERHVVLKAPGTGNEIVEEILRQQKAQRRVALTLPTLPGVGNLLAHTDLMATVPERIARTLMRIAQVQAFPPPYQFPPFTIKQHWHERYHHDPANQWLRAVIAELFLQI